MSQPEPRDRDFEALRERLTLLSEASLRINESLDFDAVLQGVLDSARSLTTARYGVMTLLDEQGELRDFLSSGLTEEQAALLWAMPDGPGIFEFLTDVTEPLRIPDMAEHIRALGFGAFTIPLRVGVFRVLAAPMFHRGARVGHVFVGDREDGAEFTRADEETLVMFASQAALVIANARTHREERQARADLETLVETSPVGVVVLDARSGEPILVNREAARNRRGPARRGPGGGADPRRGDLRARRRPRDLARGVHPGRAAERGGDGARRGDPPARPRRAQRRRPPQRHPDPRRGRRDRHLRRHPPGPHPARGAGAAAGRVPGHGEPRAADPAGGGQGLGHHAAGDGRRARTRPRRPSSTTSSATRRTRCAP